MAVLSFHGISIDWSRIGSLPAQVVQYSILMFSSPDWTKFGEALHQTLLSVEMAWIGTVFGAIIATPLSFLASRGFAPRWMTALLHGLFSLIRAIPEVVLAIILLTVTGLTPFTGALTLVITSVGTLGKWGYEAVEQADPKPIEAVRSVGGSTWQTLRWGVWPDIEPTFLSFWLYRFEVNVRASAVLGLIGAGGIGDMLSSYVQYRQWPVIGVLLIVVVMVTMLVDAASQAIRKRIVEG
ncbi:MAG: phosphonate ABC transporter, permease protein PhnE [Bifidobacterium sp.]|nr:phosphonate ABC transporter, permease protein PhnE [Bifidobacterium sp.]